LNKLIGRKKRADKFPPQNDACEYLTVTEVETRRGLAAIVQEQLERSQAAELRFESRDLAFMFNDGEGVVSSATSAADMGARRWMPPPPPVAQPLGTRDDYEEAVWQSLRQSSAAEETDLAMAIRRSLEPFASPLPTVVDIIDEVEVAGKRPRYGAVPLAAPSPLCAESGESRTLSLDDLRKARLARFDTAKLP
jgi:hypothetical protein